MTDNYAAVYKETKLYGVTQITHAELKAELDRVHNMQVECYACIHNQYMSESIIAKAKVLQAKLKKIEASLEDRINQLICNERMSRLDEIEKELASYENI